MDVNASQFGEYDDNTQNKRQAFLAKVNKNKINF